MDRRVRRSRQWLQDALKALAQEQDYDSITVLDLAKRADVNRTTFYQHFGDKDVLLDSIISDLLEPIFSEGDAYLTEGTVLSQDRTPPFVVNLFERIGGDAGFYARMLAPSGSPLFIGRMVAALESSIAARLVADPQPLAALQGVPPGLTSRYMALGMVGVLSWWLSQPEPCTPRQAADWMWQLTARFA